MATLSADQLVHLMVDRSDVQMAGLRELRLAERKASHSVCPLVEHLADSMVHSKVICSVDLMVGRMESSSAGLSDRHWVVSTVLPMADRSEPRKGLSSAASSVVMTEIRSADCSATPMADYSGGSKETCSDTPLVGLRVCLSAD